MNIFGSTLIKKYFPDFRNPNDIDWVTNDESEMEKTIAGKEEYYFMPFAPSREMTADEIYTVKASHAIYDINWKKTMSDIRFLQMKGCKIVPSFFAELREYWTQVHGEQKRTDFEVDPGRFFEDRVRRKISHDEAHEMLNPSPTYKKFVPEGGVSPSPEMFFGLPEQDQIDALFEEAFVIGIERHSHLPDMAAYGAGQQHMVTKLHPIWLADQVIQRWAECFWTAGASRFYERYREIKKQIR